MNLNRQLLMFVGLVTTNNFEEFKYLYTHLTRRKSVKEAYLVKLFTGDNYISEKTREYQRENARKQRQKLKERNPNYFSDYNKTHKKSLVDKKSN